MVQAQAPLRYLKGVGPRRAESLSAHGLETLEDLLYYLPFRYEDRRAFGRIAELGPGLSERTLAVQVVRSRLIRTRRRGFTILETQVADESGEIKAVWYNQPFLARPLQQRGARVLLYGRATLDRAGRPMLESPEYEFPEEEDAEGIHTGRIVPVYRKVGEAGSRALRQIVFRALGELDPASLPELMPQELLRRHRLLGRLDALQATHFPGNEAGLEELASRSSLAQRSLAFEEIFLLQLALALRRRGLKSQSRSMSYGMTDALRLRIAGLLPFQLTAAQQRVLGEVGADLASSHPMSRLLQGDVGSGKTIVALLALLLAVESGYQGALMAPTEILADQHYRNISRLLSVNAVECPLAVLSGSLKPSARQRTLERIRSGDARLIIGTHALFEAGVEFRKLGLVVVDEQHRFGVLQRAALASKGTRPDLLVMTATPIPRSLALTLYGDLDLSVIDEMPPGRTPIKTVVRGESDRAKVYRGVRSEVEKGRQVYFVVPLVEETATSDLKAATAFAEQLRSEIFPDLQVGMVHGRMKAADKDRVMEGFVRGAVQVLVATTVIEVGVDVPNASVMVVEHAERFGLSQLHQLRGRVGRGSSRSYCVLMVGQENHGPDARERLRVMEQTSDGFRIAEKDLDLRGPGAIFGTQQHGLSDLQFLAVILRTPGLVDTARREAQELLQRDARAEGTAGRILASLGGRWKRRLALAHVG